MKTKCFAFDSRFAGNCSALKTADCRKGDCKFFKTKEELDAQIEKCNARLRTLPRHVIANIIETYKLKGVV